MDKSNECYESLRGYIQVPSTRMKSQGNIEVNLYRVSETGRSGLWGFLVGCQPSQNKNKGNHKITTSTPVTTNQ